MGALGVEQPFRVPPSGKSWEGRNFVARETDVIAMLALSRPPFLRHPICAPVALAVLAGKAPVPQPHLRRHASSNLAPECPKGSLPSAAVADEAARHAVAAKAAPQRPA